MTRVLNRTTADLSSYPDLVVIYLGMRVNEPRGVRTLMSFGPKIRKSVEAQPDGLLLHENLLFSLFASGHEKIRVCGQLAPGSRPSFLQSCGHLWSGCMACSLAGSRRVVMQVVPPVWMGLR